MAKLRMASYNMLGGNTMKKFKFIFSVCIILSLTVLSQLNVFAMSDATSDDSISVDISDTSLNSQDDANFNEDVANDDSFSNLVVQSAQHKGKNISLDGVHPGKNIKLYGIKGSENILQSLYDSYTATGTMQNMISADYAVLKLYVNKNNEYVDSLVFTKQENLPSAKGKNGWVELCSGSMVLKDDFIVKYSQDRNLKKYVTDLGLKNTKNLKIISSIPNMPVSIYFVQENIEFLIPLDDTVNMKALQVYKVSDVFENYLKPILDFQNEKAKEYTSLDPKDIPMGTPQIPGELPAISTIDMNTYFGKNIALVVQTPITKPNSWYLIILCITTVTLIVGGIVTGRIIKKRKIIITK